MSDRDSIARALFERQRVDDITRQVEQSLLRDQEYQRSLGAQGQPNPNAMPFVKSERGAFPAQMYQDYREAGLPKQQAIEGTYDDMRGGPPQGWGWGDSPETAPGY